LLTRPPPVKLLPPNDSALSAMLISPPPTDTFSGRCALYALTSVR
jgi:hypothetical protein